MLVPGFKSKLWLRSFSHPTQPWPSKGQKEPKRGWFPFPYPPVTGLAHRELMNDVVRQAKARHSQRESGNLEAKQIQHRGPRLKPCQFCNTLGGKADMTRTYQSVRQ